MQPMRLNLPSLDFWRAKALQVSSWKGHQLAPDRASIGVSIIYTVSAIDAVLTDPGPRTLVAFGKYWHSAL
jgi:hypothetical protein